MLYDDELRDIEAVKEAYPPVVVSLIIQ